MPTTASIAARGPLPPKKRVTSCITSETAIHQTKGARTERTSVATSVATTMPSRRSGGSSGPAGCPRNCARVTPPKTATAAAARLKAA
jgi:hypothetical protein